MSAQESPIKYPNFKVLIVDDEKRIRDNFKEFLSPVVGTVKDAPDGESALKIIDTEKFDVVFLDIRMPGIDGLEVLKELNKKYSNLPVVMISAFGDRDTILESLQLGAFDFIDKPFTKEIITNCIDAIKDKDVNKHLEEEKIDETKLVQTIIAADNEKTTQVLYKIIDPLDTELHIASNLPEVTQLISSLPIDIVVISEDYPLSAVIDVCKKIRTTNYSENAYIQVISKEVSTIKINEAYSSGADDFFVAPIKPIQVKAKIVSQIKKLLKQKKKVINLTNNFRKLKNLSKPLSTPTNVSGTEVKELESKLAHASKVVSQSVAENTKLKSELEKIKQAAESQKSETEKKIQEAKKAAEAKLTEVKKATEAKISEAKKAKETKPTPKTSGNNGESGDLSKSLEEKEATIEKLSLLIQKRSKMAQVKSKSQQANVDKEKQQRETLLKVKADGKKEFLENKKVEIDEKYQSIHQVLLDAAMNIQRLCTLVENSSKAKDKIITNYKNKLQSFIKEASNDIIKFKELYYAEIKDDTNLELAQTTENERLLKIEKVLSVNQKDLEESNTGLTVQLTEIKDEIMNIQNKIVTLMNEIEGNKEEYEKTEKEWLFLLQDSYKEKYFELLDKFKEQELLIEEANITVARLEKKVEKSENEITFLRQKESQRS